MPDPGSEGEYLPIGGYVGIVDPIENINFFDNGIETTISKFKPGNLLHIYGKQNADVILSSKNMVIFENEGRVGSESTQNVHTLAINDSSVSASDTTNFITFGAGSPDLLTYPNKITSLGAIEGYGGQDRGVAFSAPERDYAEYLPKKNSDEEMYAGAIVGIYGGKVSRETKGADNLMVISSSPIVIGNWQPTYDLDDYALIAFLGQVPVTVRGKVNQGDYILASGSEDGSGIAVAETDITVMQIDKIVGKAWESSDLESDKKITTLVGFPFSKKVAYTRTLRIQKLIEKLRDGNHNLKERLSRKVIEREKQIEYLKKLIRELKRS